MQYRVLGSIELEDHGRLLPLSGPKQRALFAVFLLHANEVVSTDRLIDALWGERPPGDGRAALAMQVSRLRKLLNTNGRKVLVTHPNGYLLRVDPGELDLHLFERHLEDGLEAVRLGRSEAAAKIFRRALALWRGRPFENVEHEARLGIEVARLEERRLTALEERFEVDLALGRHHELIAELEALTGLHPQRERLRRQLMLALYRCGRQAESLRAYRDARRMLVEELGIEPGPALRQLERAILRQDPALECSPPRTGRASPRPRQRTTRCRRSFWSCRDQVAASVFRAH